MYKKQYAIAIRLSFYVQIRNNTGNGAVIHILKFCIAAFLAFLVLSSCGQVTTVTEPIAVPDGKAVVIGGVRFGHVRSENFQSAYAVWLRYDPATGLVPLSQRDLDPDTDPLDRQPGDRLILSLASCRQLDAPSGCGTARYARFAHTIKPGHYVLSEVRSRRRGSHSITETTFFVRHDGGHIARNDVPVASTGSPRFSVAEGETVYIGDFFFLARFSKTRRSLKYGYEVPLYTYKLHRIEYDESAAEAITKRFLKGNPKMETRFLINRAQHLSRTRLPEN